MKSILTKFSLLTGAAVLALASQVYAVPLGINASFGAVNPGTPANNNQEVLFINNLRSLSPVGENAPVYPALLDDGQFPNTGLGSNDPVYDRFNTVIPAGPVATATGAVNGANNDSTLDLGAVGSWSYLTGKFGQTTYAWFVGAMGGAIELPTQLGQGGGFSNYSLYNPGTPSVPDGGTTVGLIGLALGLLALARRKFAV